MGLLDTLQLETSEHIMCCNYNIFAALFSVRTKHPPLFVSARCDRPLADMHRIIMHKLVLLLILCTLLSLSSAQQPPAPSCAGRCGQANIAVNGVVCSCDYWCVVWRRAPVRCQYI